MPQSLPSYLPRPTHYRPRRVLLTLILAASYLLSYSPRPTRYHPRRVLLALILATSYSVSYSPHPTRYRPCCQHPHCHPPHSHHAHRIVLIASGALHHVVFANFPLFPTLRAMLHASKQHYYM